MCICRRAPAASLPRPDSRPGSCAPLLGWQTLCGQLPPVAHPVQTWEDFHIGLEVCCFSFMQQDVAHSPMLLSFLGNILSKGLTDY